MNIYTYRLNSFVGNKALGNPAGVSIVDFWPSDQELLHSAATNGTPETAFLARHNDIWYIRWFTNTCEIDLCGHATLAAGHVLFNVLNEPGESIRLHSGVGQLAVSHNRSNGQIILDFPSRPGELITAPELLSEALNIKPLAVWGGVDYMAVYSDQKQILAVQPDMTLLRQLDRRGLIITSPGIDCDFVSRFFLPKAGIDEDYVTGSAHCQLTPYWQQITGKNNLLARQLSSRGGELFCQLKDDRVLLAGLVTQN